MSASKILPLYEQVARLIQGEIEHGKFKPGSKIYSIREICGQFKVSDVTAKKSLRELTRRGIVRTVNGSGVFVEEVRPAAIPLDSRKSTIAFLKIGIGMAPVFAHEIDLLQQQLLKIGCPMVYAAAPGNDEVDPSLDQLLSLQPAALIVFPQHRGEFEQLPYLSRLRKASAPLLILETRSTKDSYVTTNTERATQELFNYLYELGHRRICLATIFPRKVAGFEAAIARWNDPSLKTSVLGQPGKTPIDAQKHAQQILALKPRPTAIIASDDQSAALLILYLNAAGVRVPEDMSIVTYGDEPHSNDLSPVSLTVMRHPVAEVVQEVATWVGSQLKDSSRRKLSREVTGTLIIRDSSAPPK